MKINELATRVDTLTIKVDGLVATVDDLAIATQQEFQLVREEMKEMKTDIITEVVTEITQVLGGAIERLDIHLSAYQSHTNEAIANLQELT